MPEHTLNRRNFVKTAAGSAVAGSLAAAQRTAAAPSRNGKIIGIQIGAVSFVDEGVNQVLDIVQKRAGVNALWLAGYAWSRGLVGRQVPGYPLVDHGKLEYDQDQYRGGSFATMHPQYYKDVGVNPLDLRAPDHGDFDLFEAVIPEARKRGIKIVSWIQSRVREGIPNLEKLQAVDPHGRIARDFCYNNPYHQNLLEAVAEDFVRSYDIHGIMYGVERQGALTNALGMSHGGRNRDPGTVSCFCQYCQAKAKERGIDFARVQKAFQEFEKFVRASRAGRRPLDGYHVTFWRYLLNYPELLIWEHFYHATLEEFYKRMRSRIKSANADAWFGLHIMHVNSWNPIYRAEQDLRRITEYSDFLKMVMYHNVAGPRMTSYIDSVSETIWGDVPQDELLQFHYRVLDYDEKPYEKIRYTGFKNDYVYREARRAVQAKGNAKTLILPGIDIGIPTLPEETQSTRAGVKKAVTQAFQAGADGIILSRKYSEMRLDALSGAGDAVKELGLA